MDEHNTQVAPFTNRNHSDVVIIKALQIIFGRGDPQNISPIVPFISTVAAQQNIARNDVMPELDFLVKQLKHADVPVSRR